MELSYTARRTGQLSSFLRGEMAMSAGLMNRMKWQQKLFVNGISRHTDYAVQPGDVITVPLDEPEPEYPAEDGPLTVIYEDEHILAVDKPAGILIHPSHAQITGTLANLVLGYYLKTGQASAFHPITRLDRDTFGIVLLAKNAHIHGLLSACRPKKTYEALVYGGPAQDSLVINAPIARLPLPSLLRQVDDTGKPSVTECRVLERLDGYTKVSLCPITGRTHQLRVHCAYKDFPILGDPQYGSADSQAFSLAHGLNHQQLCAKKLEFDHPITGVPLVLTSKMKVQL